MPSSLENWKRIQAKDYFRFHPHYNTFKLDEVPNALPYIEGRTIAEIGCGYGRETAFFSKYAKRIYAIEVSELVFEYLRKFVKGPAELITVLADEWEDKIPDNSLDYVRSRATFQHLGPDDSRDYIEGMYDKLKVDGIIDIQTLVYDLGYVQIDDDEPNIQLPSKVVIDMFSRYNIVSKYVEAGTEKGKRFNSLYVKAMKVR